VCRCGKGLQFYRRHDMMGLVDKRVNRRFDAHHRICIYSSGIIRLGTMSNCSESGMYIETIIKRDTSFSLESVFEIHIPLKEENVKVLAKTVRLEGTGEFYEGMGVELVTIPQQYVEYLIRLNLGSYV
jgi:hypothetical protein